ncbi:hypothetical protein SEUCBS139899_008970 [Sporothrix eucalyptigena]
MPSRKSLTAAARKSKGKAKVKHADDSAASVAFSSSAESLVDSSTSGSAVAPLGNITNKGEGKERAYTPKEGPVAGPSIASASSSEAETRDKGKDKENVNATHIVQASVEQDAWDDDDVTMADKNPEFDNGQILNVLLSLATGTDVRQVGPGKFTAGPSYSGPFFSSLAVAGSTSTAPFRQDRRVSRSILAKLRELPDAPVFPLRFKFPLNYALFLEACNSKHVRLHNPDAFDVIPIDPTGKLYIRLEAREPGKPDKVFRVNPTILSANSEYFREAIDVLLYHRQKNLRKHNKIRDTLAQDLNAMYWHNDHRASEAKPGNGLRTPVLEDHKIYIPNEDIITSFLKWFIGPVAKIDWLCAEEITADDVISNNRRKRAKNISIMRMFFNGIHQFPWVEADLRESKLSFDGACFGPPYARRGNADYAPLPHGGPFHLSCQDCASSPATPFGPDLAPFPFDLAVFHYTFSHKVEQDSLTNPLTISTSGDGTDGESESESNADDSHEDVIGNSESGSELESESESESSDNDDDDNDESVDIDEDDDDDRIYQAFPGFRGQHPPAITGMISIDISGDANTALRVAQVNMILHAAHGKHDGLPRTMSQADIRHMHSLATRLGMLGVMAPHFDKWARQAFLKSHRDPEIPDLADLVDNGLTAEVFGTMFIDHNVFWKARLGYDIGNIAIVQDAVRYMAWHLHCLDEDTKKPIFYPGLTDIGTAEFAKFWSIFQHTTLWPTTLAFKHSVGEVVMDHLSKFLVMCGEVDGLKERKAKPSELVPLGVSLRNITPYPSVGCHFSGSD